MLVWFISLKLESVSPHDSGISGEPCYEYEQILLSHIMALSRITITIPEELVVEADRKAAELDRSRSWVLVDAVRQYLTPEDAAVREPEVQYIVGLGASRRAQLDADLRLTPEERVAEAERTLLVEQALGRLPKRDRVLTFDRYEDYLDWKRHEAVRT